MYETLISLIPVIVDGIFKLLGIIAVGFFTLVGAIAGGLIGYKGALNIFNRQIEEGKKEKKREKLEEAFKEIKKIRIFVKYVILRPISIIHELELTKLPYLEEAPVEQLTMLLSLYSREFQEEIDELEEKWTEFLLKNKEILELINKKSSSEIASMADDSKTELLSICNNIESKIKNIFEKE